MSKMTRMVIAVAVLLGAGSALADEYSNSTDQMLRFREAAFYPQYASNSGVDVGIDKLTKDDQVRIFGRKISGYLPYNVAITNNSSVRVYIDDIQLQDRVTRSATMPRDLDAVLNKTGTYYSGNKGQFRMSILRENLISKSLQSTVVLPGQTVQGVVFARETSLGEDGGDLKIRLQSLERVAFVEIAVPFAR